MNINWKLRLQNKTTLVSLILGIIAIVYQILTAFNIVPKIEQQAVVQIILAVIDILCLVGIVVDPTTAGLNDSARAMGYDKPNKDTK